MSQSREIIKAIKLIQYIDYEFKNLYQLIDYLIFIPRVTSEQYEKFISDAINFNHLLFFYYQFFGNVFDEELNHVIISSFNRLRELDDISRFLITKVVSTK